MNTRKTYYFSVLRYVHDVSTGEFINVGVAVLSPSDKFFEVRCRSTVGRLADVFPDLNGRNFRSLMRLVSSRFAEIARTIDSSQMEFSDSEFALSELLERVNPVDDSALQWSKPSPGRAASPRLKVPELFCRYVSKYDERQINAKRTDTDIWRHFKKELEQRHVAKFFTEKTIEVADDEVSFKSAWKNGIWHCIEPVSFDLSSSETIKEKAHRLLGQITSIKDSAEAFKVYLLLGEPMSSELQPAFQSAIKILKKLPVDNELYLESQSIELAENFAVRIAAHEDSDGVKLI